MGRTTRLLTKYEIMNVKNILLLSCTMALVACGESEEEKLAAKRNADVQTIKSNIVTYLEGISESDPSGIIIDSIQLHRVDTLNEKRDTIMMVNAYLNRMTKINDYRDLLQHQTKNKIEMAKLQKSIGMDVEGSRYDAQRLLDRVNAISKRSDRLLDHVMTIDSLTRTDTYDSVATTGYLAIVKLFAHDRKKAAVKIDSIEFVLDNDFFINEKLKNTGEVNFDKL